ncbi:hypothetical protein BASA81_001369 [Batrachochytrium salamandrivorans]|nr:hypothetical protein BASA81_001369 [Batrachochytrium salamandrivorans]
MILKRFLASTPEAVQSAKFERWLRSPPLTNASTAALSGLNFPLLVDAAFATFLLHVKSRQAALDGAGFYTIGPCGEEFAACWGQLLRDGDTASLHYRHVAAQIARQLALGKPMEDVLLDRSRGFVCSTLDPVTGGRHCAIGGVENLFYNTSTLASQVPAAVGRALAGALLPSTSNNSVHFVSLGDGSAHNAAFLSAKNLAENATYRNIKCPVLFCITDNDLCISLKQHGYIQALIKTFQIPVFECHDANDFPLVFAASQQAFDKVRQTQKPAVLVVRNVRRRFGHAATDRQLAYLDAEEIDRFANDDTVLKSLCTAAASSGQLTFDGMLQRFRSIQTACDAAFAQAQHEPKLNDPNTIAQANQAEFDTSGTLQVAPQMNSGKLTMRKCMTLCLEEQMTQEPNLVYLGEDVRHGGYYLVTEGLAKRFPKRVLDFPPDETNLIGCGLGFAQRGLIPIVELPYLKYLDCGADQFFEVCLTHWITNGRPKQTGVIFRLQGFDRGKFGGNFHTHNTLYLPPGLDVLCFSNGRDWAKGFRECVRAAKQGRIVALVDSTHALNKRHLFKEGDDLWMMTELASGESRLEDITLYSPPLGKVVAVDGVIVTYGNGVPDALLVQREFAETRDLRIDVIDCPLLSKVPGPLMQYLESRPNVPVLFADCCKIGQNPFGGFVQHLQMDGQLVGRKWAVAAAPFTYNPLGSTATFLNPQMIQSRLETILN